ncbi:monovalent cation:proton antiporter-2 (CPA2) family protein [Pasteurella bettyae]|uniref:Transporter, CPA2 family n=1 Tax=Pasteurella bettyae CCUG 2042 TaxID=1095749 RepID=I3DA12_9PAST|nr:monovalent cation:proton antiporter-2 (CPA2) family protein [Pasteurella bettyae]EIJ68555.1 transporter, CPA2 family [Pasteurella bettyae CCUG 2042]SUB22705.1 glutathione-regulated potassium-efflux system protein [Pasteurella bettyae]
MAAESANQLVSVVTLLTAAVLIVPLFKRLGLGSVLGYLAAGLVIGPFGFGLSNDPQAILHIAELGVVMFLFIIGLEMKPSHLWSLRKQIFGLGSLQVFASGVLITLVGYYLLNFSFQTAFIIASGFVLTSTAIVVQILTERGDIGSPRGQRMISVLLFEDLLIVPLFAIVTFLSSVEGASDAEPIWQQILIAMGGIGILLLSGRYLNPLFRILASTKLREMMTAAALLVVLGSALLMEASGLSTAMGAFMAGVLLSESSFRHQLEADIEPFRGLLLGLFFLGVGMSLDLSLVMKNFRFIIMSVLLLMLANAIGIFMIGRLTRASLTDAFDRAVVMALGGEFAFVLYSAAASQRVITRTEQANGVAIVVISMLLSPVFILVYKKLIEPRLPKKSTRPDDYIEEQKPIILIGFGRFGQIVHDLIIMTGHHATVIDLDESMIAGMKRFGVKGYYGNATRPELLQIAGIEQAKLLIVAIDDQEKSTRIVKLARKFNPNLTIIARAFDRIHVYQLQKAGANKEVRETFESALQAGKFALSTLGISQQKVEEIAKLYARKDEQAVQLMADAYDPKFGRFDNEEIRRIVLEQDQDLTRLIQEILACEDKPE